MAESGARVTVHLSADGGPLVSGVAGLLAKAADCSVDVACLVIDHLHAVDGEVAVVRVDLDVSAAERTGHRVVFEPSAGFMKVLAAIKPYHS
jgi:hypothetical protein